MAEPTDNQEEQAPKTDLTALRAKDGDWEAVARNLAYKVDEREADNFRLRQKNRELKGLIPADDARVLTAEQAATLDALTADLTAAGIETPDKLKAHLETAASHAAKVADDARRADLEAVAAAAGIESVDALAAVFTDGEAFEIEGEGDDRKVYVRPADGDRAELGAYLDADPTRAALKPALFAAPAAEPAPGVRFPAQPAGGRPPAPRTPDPAEYAERKRRSGEYDLV